MKIGRRRAGRKIETTVEKTVSINKQKSDGKVRASILSQLCILEIYLRFFHNTFLLCQKRVTIHGFISIPTLENAAGGVVEDVVGIHLCSFQKEPGLRNL